MAGMPYPPIDCCSYIKINMNTYLITINIHYTTTLFFILIITSMLHHCFFSQLGNRPAQQDCLAPTEPTAHTSFFVVCDGVGGRDHGEIASSLVCQSFEHNLANNDCCNLKAADIVSLTNEAYKTLYKNRAVCASMATTLAFMAKTDEGMLLAHLGDSRIYQIRKGEGVVFQTKDHSLVNDLLDSGEIKPEEVKNHPKGNVITKCLFVTDDKDRYMTPTITLIRDIKPHDVFMLCTDGVYGMVDNDDLAEILTSDISLEERTKELAAICRNSLDNNTAYIVEIDGIDDDGTDKKENITYTINKPRKTIKSRFFDFVRETLGFVKET